MGNYHSNNEIAQILRDLHKRNNNYPAVAEIAEQLSRISTKISDLLSDQEITSIRDDIVIGSERSGNPFGDFPINIIPGDPDFACCSVLVAVATGLDGPCSFEKILNRCLKHLKDCAGSTIVFLFYTDSWDETLFKRKFRKKFIKAAISDKAQVCSFFSVCTNPISGPRLVEFHTP